MTCGMSEFQWTEIRDGSITLHERVLPNGKSAWRQHKDFSTRFHYIVQGSSILILTRMTTGYTMWGNTTRRLVTNNKLTTYITCHQNIETMHDIHPVLARLPVGSVNLATVPSARFPGSQPPRLVPSFAGRDSAGSIPQLRMESYSSTAVPYDRIYPTTFWNLDLKRLIITHDYYTVMWN